MFCKNCGKEITDNIKFCPECGASQETSIAGIPSESEKIIFVSINETYPTCGTKDGRPNLYECTRKYWRVNLEKAMQADYIAGVYKGSVKTIYKIKKGSWKLVRDQPEMLKEPEVIAHPDYKNRYSVEGETGEHEAQELKGKYTAFRLYGSVGYNY